MNIEIINKWLDEEYGCSYTRLEELHDFYFEKYCDLQQENKQLKDNWNELREVIRKKQDYYRYVKDNRYRKFLSELLDKMQELEGSDSNE